MSTSSAYVSFYKKLQLQQWSVNNRHVHVCMCVNYVCKKRASDFTAMYVHLYVYM